MSNLARFLYATAALIFMGMVALMLREHDASEITVGEYQRLQYRAEKDCALMSKLQAVVAEGPISNRRFDELQREFDELERVSARAAISSMNQADTKGVACPKGQIPPRKSSEK